MENSKRKKPDPFVIRAIAEALQLDYLKLYRILGYIDDESIANAEYIPDEAFSKIPVFSFVRAGIEEGIEFPEPVEFIDLPYIKNGNDVIAIYVKGDSMEPRVFEGDMVVVRQNVMPDNGKMGVFVYNNDTTVKLYNQNPESGEIILTSLNQNHFPKSVKKHDDFHIVGKVIMVVNKYA